MDNNQLVQITLEEYMLLKELANHKKEVKIIEEYRHDDRVGLNVAWESDGMVWMKLTGKLRNAGDQIRKLIKEKDELKQMSVFEFMKWRKEN